MSEIKIVECTRCHLPQVFKPNMKDSEIPVALEVNIDGGYGMFVDNFDNKTEYQLLLCHKCAHEFTQWINIDLGHGHPKTNDEFCNGWTIEEGWAKELEFFKKELDDWVFINQDTMIAPFDNYEQKKATLESIIKSLEENLNGKEKR